VKRRRRREGGGVGVGVEEEETKEGIIFFSRAIRERRNSRGTKRRREES
jgi:hypothetical protein